jgi:hypothetical protein
VRLQSSIARGCTFVGYTALQAQFGAPNMMKGCVTYG